MLEKKHPEISLNVKVRDQNQMRKTGRQSRTG